AKPRRSPAPPPSPRFISLATLLPSVGPSRRAARRTTFPSGPGPSRSRRTGPLGPTVTWLSSRRSSAASPSHHGRSAARRLSTSGIAPASSVTRSRGRIVPIPQKSSLVGHLPKRTGALLDEAAPDLGEGRQREQPPRQALADGQAGPLDEPFPLRPQAAAEGREVERGEHRRLVQHASVVPDTRVALLGDRHALGAGRLDEGPTAPAPGVARVVAQDELEEPAPHGMGVRRDRLDRPAALELGAQHLVVAPPAAIELLETREAPEREEHGVEVRPVLETEAQVVGLEG